MKLIIKKVIKFLRIFHVKKELTFFQDATSLREIQFKKTLILSNIFSFFSFDLIIKDIKTSLNDGNDINF